MTEQPRTFKSTFRGAETRFDVFERPNAKIRGKQRSRTAWRVVCPAEMKWMMH